MTGDLLGSVDILLQHNVPLVIIGGHAVNAHGFLRTTEDVDVVFHRTTQSESNLYDALVELDAFWIGSEIDPHTGIEKTHAVTQAYIKANRLIMVGTRCGYLDLFDYLPALPDVPLEDLFSTAVSIDGRPHCSLSMLRRLKRASGRPQDLIDLENLPTE